MELHNQRPVDILTPHGAAHTYISTERTSTSKSKEMVRIYARSFIPNPDTIPFNDDLFKPQN